MTVTQMLMTILRVGYVVELQKIQEGLEIQISEHRRLGEALTIKGVITTQQLTQQDDVVLLAKLEIMFKQMNQATGRMK